MKTIGLVFTFMLIAICGKAQSLTVFIHDTNGKYTNLRSTPNGKIVKKLSTKGTFILEVEDPRNGWWEIDDDIFDCDEEKEIDLDNSNHDYFIHYSTIAVGTRNYGGQRLYLRKAANEKSAVVYTFNEEIELRPMDIKNGWVKVQTLDKKHTGWIEEEWLCGNPFTNCC
ncbi:SH3 domain-containing protein [Prevotella koreensis]|uniref:SH3 domain-containing protein n=1 Tax=Prevotella koreensis TaxID=2490854 RepID=A0A432LLJ9_9BACT|nr:SH3 domain-containing protein [Prevotella koreensis]RUL59693.1 SH3 domain-containing protein [Prevotella koreensis]